VNISWKIALALLLALTASISASGAESNFILNIFGNANMDDTIDEKDIEYVEGAIKGTNAATNLSDANFDRTIDEKDIDQIKDIIEGKEKTLTIFDSDGDVVTIAMPVKRIIPDHITSLAAIRILDAENMIVGTQAIIDYMGPTFLQNLSELPSVGGYMTPDYEAILSLNPDVYFLYRASSEEKETTRNNLPGVTVISAGYYEPYDSDKLTMDMRMLGYILNKRDKAEEYIEWYNHYLNLINERIKGLSDEEKPKVYITCFGLYKCRSNFPPCDIAGGINIGTELNVNPGQGGSYCTTVSSEWVIEQNPDIIIDPGTSKDYGYDIDDPSAVKAIREDIMNHPELSNVTAVKMGKVYNQDIYSIGLFPNNIIAIAYYAKLFHPDLFEDLNPQAIHQEYLDKFSPIDINIREHGVFFYPPLNES
jgi:iron complex transport system substrate-binding protein